MVDIINNIKIRNMLNKIEKDMSCKTVLDTIDNMIGKLDVGVQVYTRDIIPLTYVIVYEFNRFNKLRLVIIKKDRKNITYSITLYSSYNDLSKGEDCYTEIIEDKSGNREEILEYLKEKGSKFIDIVKNNNSYIYAVRYLINYAIKLKMNRISAGYIDTKYTDGLYLIYKDRWITDEEGYRNMYCFQGYGDTLRIINSLVIQNIKGEFTKLNEDIIYDGAVTDLNTAWNKMKYVVYDSKEEKELIKKLKNNNK